jgi:hypothetical protein
MRRFDERGYLLVAGLFALGVGWPVAAAAQEPVGAQRQGGAEAQVPPLTALPPAASQPAASSPAVLRFGGVELSPDLRLFADYSIDLAADDLDNGFHVTRGYLGLRVKMTPWLGGRVTLDVSQATDLGRAGAAAVTDEEAEVEASRLQGSSLARLKYGYVDIRVTRLSLSVRAGVLQTPWLEWIERVEGTRFLRRAMLEQDLGAPSADFGMALIGTITDYLAYHVGLYSGEGYAGIEDTPFKDLIGRITLRPAARVRGLQCLQLSGYAGAELVAPRQGSVHETRRRYGGALTYRLVRDVVDPDCSSVGGERLALWFQAFFGQDGLVDELVGSFGLSGGFRVELPARLFVIGRVDRFDPDLEASGDAVWTALGALGVHVADGVVIALDYQGQIRPDGDGHRLGIHTELRL